MRIEDIATRISGSRDLPAMSGTGQKLMRLIADPNVTIQKIAAVVAMDPALAASVMRIANSASYGFKERTHDLGHAITRIGLRMLKTLVVTTSVLRSVDGAGSIQGLDRRGYWRFSLAAATGARIVAHVHRPILGDEAFLVGLLQGIGVTVLDVYFPEELASSLMAVSRDRLPLSEAVRSTTGFGIGMIGALLLTEWELAEPLCNAVAATSGDIEPADDDARLLLAYARIGTMLARAAGIGTALDAPPPDASLESLPWADNARRLEDAMSLADVTPEHLDQLLDRLRAEFAVFEGLAGDKAA